MKTVSRVCVLWSVLAVLSWLMANATDSDLGQLISAGGLFSLPPLAVWLTARATASLPERRFLRIPFWAVTLGGWLVALILMQRRSESAHADQHQNFLLALGLCVVTGVWLSVRSRSWPTWRVLREAAAGFAVIALAGAVFAWRYEARTRAIFARAEARWTEIGLPLAEFEKTLAPSHENAGSEVVRQVLREQVGTRFYKEGTAAAGREPVVERSQAKDNLIQRACDIVSAKLPPSDALDLSAVTTPDSAHPRLRAVRNSPQAVATTEPAPPPLEEAFARILAAEPATWAIDPHDGILLSVPNFLGVRKFSQLTAAEAMRRFEAGDTDGAARALSAGLRVSESLRANPALVSLMIHVAVDAMLTSRQVRLPATEDGLASVARDVPILRAEFLRRFQLEAWFRLHFTEQVAVDELLDIPQTRPLPKWARHLADRPAARRQCAIALLNGAEHIALFQSAASLTLPDFGANLHEAIGEKNPSIMELNFTRINMRIHATLLLREQSELIRDARARLAAGRPVESRDSAVLPGVRWELIADTEKNTVATRLAGAPQWIVKGDVTEDGFWLLPLDGSIAWQFRPSAHTAGRF